MKRLYLFFLVATMQAAAQKPLKIGDKVPEIVFTKTINNQGKPVRLSDLRGRIVVLDMWSIHCSSCIGAFPQMDSLQRIFKDSIQILLANPYPETRAQITALLDRRKLLTGFSTTLPIVYNAAVLEKYFPHVSVPHEVWIGPNGKVIAITFATDVTRDHIRAAFAGQLHVAEKNDYAFNPSKPLSGDTSSVVFSSVISKYRPGLTPQYGTRTDSGQRVSGYFMINQSLRYLIQNAYREELQQLPDNRVVIESDRPGRFARQPSKDAVYCYDLNFPSRRREGMNVNAFLREDLQRTFGIRVKKMEREEICYVVRAGERQHSNYEKPDVAIEAALLQKYYHGYASKELIAMINHLSAVAFVDETDGKVMSDVDFAQGTDITDPMVLADALRQAGFEVVRETRKLPVMVITDK